ncbi:MAG: Methylmalonyl-CoA carboxyltransferase 12S subunit [Firmicutes bacterium ADurb.Bin193]|nr:MAG: Methylmalonyl-CoA carboxyltransferase 12S subunit [Firmicutes bacterium ADurb.Bin193]
MNNTDKTAVKKQRIQAQNIAAQSENGKNSACARINKLFDNGSFIEIGGFASDGQNPSGVITGYGTVDERLVFVWAQDFHEEEGALGSVGAKKISDILDMAVKVGAPVVSILDSNGVRINEGVNALSGIGEILSRVAKTSGVVPQIAMVLGPCAGSAVFAAGLCDFVFMTETDSSMYMTGPAVTSGVTGKQTDAASLGGGNVCAKNGTADFVYKSDDECIAGVRRLLSYLPSNNIETSPFAQGDDINRISNILPIIPDDGSGYDMVALIKEIADNSEFFEAAPSYSPSMITGFANLGGGSVGIVANQPLVGGGILNIDAAKKAAMFIRICDSFNIPIVTFVDTPGFEIGMEQEHGGISVYGAALLYAYAEASVPKVSVAVGKACGGAYLAMGAKPSGADLALAYPFAQISVLSPETAANIVFRDDIASSADPVSERAAKISEYAKTVASPYTAANDGFIDDIIDPETTRVRLISALDMLAGKREERIPKKHGNMPV